MDTINPEAFPSGQLQGLAYYIKDTVDEINGRLSETQLNARFASSASVTSAFTVATRGYPVKRPSPSKVAAYLGASGHGYTGTADTGGSTNMNDTSVPLVGSQSIRLTPGPGTYAHATRTGLTAFSVRNKILRVVLRYTDGVNLQSLSVRLGSGGGFTDQISQNILAASYADSGEDFTLDVPLGAATVTGSPNLDAINSIRIFGSSKAGVQGYANIGAIYLVDQDVTSYPNGVLIIGFDDCHISHFTEAFPYMAKYGFPGTLYPNIERMIAGAGAASSPGYTLAQGQYMQDVGGWDFAAHAIDSAHHVDHVGQTESWLRDHFEAIISYYKTNNLRGNAYAWPNATSDALARRVVADYFRTARGGNSEFPETVNPTRPMNLRAVNLNSQMSGGLTTMKSYVDRVKAAKAVQPVFFHRLVPSAPTVLDTSYADFEAFIDYVAASGVAVATVSQVYA